ncbi:hypothetical protein FRX31_021150 [Thalictrum thalictroides]|uniref:Uncharacterized protein n=1 Tax=Thalictrum thalictroides TaxID=46969 RepID=A0A7J6VWP6_THATH|nr:hypothetical protein FRX31_021150 [Thalictrum thalictroides]
MTNREVTRDDKYNSKGDMGKDPYVCKDTICWISHLGGRYTIKTAYNILIPRLQRFQWAKIIWSSVNTKKSSFVSWLAGSRSPHHSGEDVAMGSPR